MAKFKIDMEAEKEKTTAAKNAGQRGAIEAKGTSGSVKKQPKAEAQTPEKDIPADDTHEDTHVHTQEHAHVQYQGKRLDPVRKELGSTRGKKGQKLPRINMAFSDDNYDFIRDEAKRLNMTMTEFVNELVRSYRGL